MTPETAERIQRLLRELWTNLGRMTGCDSHESVIAKLRTLVKDPVSAQFAHEQARKTFQMKELDSIRPGNLYELFSLVSSTEKEKNFLESLPEESAPQIELQLQEILKNTLPNMRAGFIEVAKRLPHRRGGRPRTAPKEGECRQICEEILGLIGKGYETGYAQRRVATNWDLSLRTTERIWHRRSKLLDDT
jgi:hypothetical protein